jgi:aldehyde:ferredoxin oxidoreductase
MDGYAGKILRINLTSGRVSEQRVVPDLIEKYLGGNGFGAKILFDEIEENIDPLGPKNKVIFATGPFVGTMVPGGNKCGAFTKSPLTNIFGESYCGGTFGPELKYAGYDILVIEGKAEEPVYIWIHDDVRIRDAKRLWSLDCYETEEAIRRERKFRDLSIASIGPAGENLIKYACVTHGRGRQFGRTGLGAVMGSKNLKAIVIRGNKRITIADSGKFIEQLHKTCETIKISDFREQMVKYGLTALIASFHRLGMIPDRNFHSSYSKDVKALDGHSWVPLYQVSNTSCFSCIIPCSKLLKIKEGEIRDAGVEGPKFQTIVSLGANCGIYDFEAVVRANELCNRYGMDTISAGGVIAFAMECYEGGLFTRKDVDNIDLIFGNHRVLLRILSKIAHREGIGDLLADGVKVISEKIGKGSEHFAVQAKGLEAPGFDVRSSKGMALSFAVSNRGACHLRSCEHVLDYFGSFNPLGIKNIDRLKIDGKGKLVAELENFYTIYDCLTLCKFYGRFFGMNEIATLLFSITGKNIDAESLMIVADRVNNVERLFNIREGISRKDDTLPTRITEAPSPSMPTEGEKLSQQDLSKMLDDYYEARGWDDNGLVTSQKLKELDLDTS